MRFLCKWFRFLHKNAFMNVVECVMNDFSVPLNDFVITYDVLVMYFYSHFVRICTAFVA
jgi:hypothetical protein